MGRASVAAWVTLRCTVHRVLGVLGAFGRYSTAGCRRCVRGLRRYGTQGYFQNRGPVDITGVQKILEGGSIQPTDPKV